MAWFLRMLQESKGKDETDGIGEVGELPNGSEVVIDESQVLPNGDVPVLPADEADGSSLIGYGYGYGVGYGEASGGNFLWNYVLISLLFLAACCVSLSYLAQKRNVRRAELGAAGRGSGTVLAHAVQPVSRDSTVVIGEVVPGSLVRGDVI